MAIKQNNKTQSDIRFNLSNILGLSEEQAKMIAQNQDRLRGGIAQTYFNGRNAGTESGGTDPTCTPCGGGGGGGSGGGGGGGGSGGGGGVIFPCVDEDCVTLAEAAELTRQGDNVPCCIKGGKDCETGEDIPICLTENCGGGYGQGCNPPPYGDCGTFTVVIATRDNQENIYRLSTFENIEGDLQIGANESLEIRKAGVTERNPDCSGVRSTENQDTTITISCNGESKDITYPRQIKCIMENSKGQFCSIVYGVVSFKQGGGTQEEYNKALLNWKKHNGKYLRGGKFYDACNISGEDCFTVCDENGNQYKICANNGKPKVTPVA